MSKRLGKKYKKHCAFVWAVNTFEISNEFLLHEVLTDVVFDLLPPKNGETDTEGTLQYIQDVRDQKRPLPPHWMDELKSVLSQICEQRYARSDRFDLGGPPTWYGRLPPNGDKLREFFTLFELISVGRDVPSYLLEEKELDSPADAQDVA